MAADLAIIVRGVDHASGVFKNIDGHASKLGGTMGNILKAGALGAAAGIGVAAVAGIAFIKQAAEEEAGIKRLAAAVDASGGSWEKQGAEIEKVIQGRQRLAFSDDELRSSLALLTAITGDSDEALRRQAVAMDFARGANIDLGTASKLLGKVTDETVNVLGRYGIRVKEGADATDVLALVQQKFSGQSQAFADSAAGKWAQFKIQMDNLAETIGAALLPVVTALGGALASFAEKAIPKVEKLVQTALLLAKAFIAAASGEGVTSSGIFGFFERLGVIVHDTILPAVKDFAKFFKGEILPAVKDFVSSKNNLVALGAAVGALFTVWAVTAGIAAVATIAAAAPLIALTVAVAAVAAGFVILEQKTGIFSAMLPVAIDVLKELYDIIQPTLSEALVTLQQGWADLQPVIESVAKFLSNTLVPVFEDIGAFLGEHPALLAGLVIAIGLLVAPWLLVVAAIVIVLAKWDEIKAMFTQTIPDAIDSVITKIKELPIIGAIFTDTFNTVKVIVETYLNLVILQVQFALDTIRNIFAFFKAIFSGDWDAAWNAVKAQAEAIWNLLAGSFGLALDAIKSLADSKLTMLLNIGKSIGSAVGSGVTAGFDVVKGGITSALNWIIMRINEFIRTINRVLSAGGIGGLLGKVGINLPQIPEVGLIGQGGGVGTGDIYTPPSIPLGGGGRMAGNTTVVNVTYNENSMINTASPANKEIAADLIESLLRQRMRYA